MYTVYYIDRNYNRQECGSFKICGDAINEALAAIYDERWAIRAVVEKDGKIVARYLGSL